MNATTLTADERQRLKAAGLNPISERFFGCEGLLEVEVAPSRMWRVLTWPYLLAYKWRGFGAQLGVRDGFVHHLSHHGRFCVYRVSEMEIDDDAKPLERTA